MKKHNSIFILLCHSKGISDRKLNSLAKKLPKNQQDKLLDFKSKKRRKEFILGRSLLVHALKHYKSPILVNPIIKERNANSPCLENYEAHYVSISHSRDIVCCVIHNSLIGVDVEYKKSREGWSESAQFFMDKEELTQLNEFLLPIDKKDFFYKIWCIKEAIFKTLSYEMQKETSLHSIPSISFFHKNKDWSLFETSLADYQLSLTYTGVKCTVECSIVDISNEAKEEKLI